jgi:hypothetical protein
MVIALAAIPRPNKMIASLIINPADGKPIDEGLLALAFADENQASAGKVRPALFADDRGQDESWLRCDGCLVGPQ